MATYPDGTEVQLGQGTISQLRFPPPSHDLTIAVHKSALKSPDLHTQLVHIVANRVDWVGALGEDLLTKRAAAKPVRAILAQHLLTGERLWEIVKPGSLLHPGRPSPLSSIYAGSPQRPWVVVGETCDQDLICAPLNDPRGNPKWWTPVVAQADMTFAGNSKDGQVELAHLWSLPADMPRHGQVDAGHAGLEAAIKGYFP